MPVGTYTRSQPKYSVNVVITIRTSSQQWVASDSGGSNKAIGSKTGASDNWYHVDDQRSAFVESAGEAGPIAGAFTLQLVSAATAGFRLGPTEAERQPEETFASQRGTGMFR